MALVNHPLHESSLLRIQCVCCRPEGRSCGTVEHAPANMLVLPLNGVFIKHHECGPEVVASAAQALFFNAGEAYRVSHPLGSGDDCLVLEPSASALREILECFDAGAADRACQPFRRTHARLPPAVTLQSRLLWNAVRHNGKATLDVESCSLELLGAALSSTGSTAPPVVDRRSRSRQRRREQVQACAIALAARPEADWTLGQLSQQVHSSPFHLARSFRSEFGESIHQYLLRVRLTRALDAVLDSTFTLTAVAAQLGFATPSHFSAAFRKAYGLTPSTLRQVATRGLRRELRRILTASPPQAH